MKQIKSVHWGKTTYTIYRSDAFTAKIGRCEVDGKVTTLIVPDRLLVAYVAEMVRACVESRTDEELVGLIPPLKGSNE